MINKKIIHHTENFWGSGSYSKSVRPNGFFTDELLQKVIVLATALGKLRVPRKVAQAACRGATHYFLSTTQDRAGQ